MTFQIILLDVIACLLIYTYYIFLFYGLFIKMKPSDGYREKVHKKKSDEGLFMVESIKPETNENNSIENDTKSVKEKEIKKAISLHLKGDISKAMECYKNCLEKGFYNPLVLSNLGIIYQQRGEVEKAIQLYKKSISYFPNNPEAYVNLGTIFFDIGKLKEAEIFQRKAIELKPDHAIAYNNLGNTLRGLGRLDESEKLLRKSIELNQEFSNSHYNLGIVLKELGRLEDAENSLKKAIKINPNYAMAYNNLGGVLGDLGKLEEARITLLKAIELKPDYAIAFNNLGNTLRDLGKLNDAEKYILKANSLSPDDKNISINLINLLTIHSPCDINSSQFFLVNEDFKRIDLPSPYDKIITDDDAIGVYQSGLEIYRKYKLDLKTNLSQIYNRNDIALDCKRHLTIFDQHKIIPEFCFGCYKVQVEVFSVVELIKLFLVFNDFKIKNNNTRKCMIELRKNIPGFYKGFIYCRGVDEAIEVSNQLNNIIQKNIRIDLNSKVKHGCSEFSLEFPQFKAIGRGDEHSMQYNENWHSIEKDFDQGNKEWEKSIPNIKGFNLNDFLIMREWLAYAQEIGDLSFKKITKEQISYEGKFKNLNKSLLVK